MPNHSHLVAVPEGAGSLRACLAEVHRRYTRTINFRKQWRGYLWQGRFASVAMDKRHTVVAGHYVMMNPVRAGLVSAALDWPYSSARIHAGLERDSLIDPQAYQGLVDPAELLVQPDDPATLELVRLHTRTGRPLGSDHFVEDVEKAVGRAVRPQAPGRRAG